MLAALKNRRLLIVLAAVWGVAMLLCLVLIVALVTRPRKAIEHIATKQPGEPSRQKQQPSSPKRYTARELFRECKVDLSMKGKQVEFIADILATHVDGEHDCKELTIDAAQDPTHGQERIIFRVHGPFSAKFNKFFDGAYDNFKWGLGPTRAILAGTIAEIYSDTLLIDQGMLLSLPSESD